MSKRTRIGSITLLLLGAVICFSTVSKAQTDSEGPQGTVSGNYNIQETAEVGYRQSWIDGNQDTYDTFVNLNSGVRLLDYTLDMRSLNHQGLLFDNLNFSNFGYGGDPNDVSRLHIQKNKLYDFSLVFRRDKNFWDYNLLANPLNPVPIPPAGSTASYAITNPSFALNQSPHSLDLVRRMQDYNLTLLPESRVRIRLGYSRNVDEGPALSTYAATDDILLAQDFETTTDSYRIGVDFRILPKTTISYDQFLEYDKQDTSDSLANTPFLVSTNQFPGTLPVNMGINWYYPPAISSAVPCATPFLTTGYANTACKMLSSYVREAPVRNSMPTERLSFQSTVVPKLEMSGAASYSSSNNVALSLFDSANEWTASATNQIRDAILGGSTDAKQIQAHANWNAAYSITNKIKILDSLLYDNWQNPGVFNQLASNQFAQGAPIGSGDTGILLPIAQFAPVAAGGPTFASICSAPYTGLTCPQHSSTASADQTSTINSTYMGQRLISNTFQIQADLTRRISARIGYMYENRVIAETSTSQALSDTYYPGGATATVANDFLAARGNCPYSNPTGTPPYTFSPAAGGGCTQNADGSVTWTASPATILAAIDVPRTLDTINEQVGLAGITLRPVDSLRINADFQFGYNDNSFTRIWPRQVQGYKVHVDYKPRTWATFDGAVDIHENRDNVYQIDNLEHARTFGFSMTLMTPNSKLSYTLGYNYTNIFLQTYICFNDSFPAQLAGPGIPIFPPCAISNSTVAQGATEFYVNQQQYAYSDIIWKPINRVTTEIGYVGTFAGGTELGTTLFLNPLQPAGTLAFNYQKPYASVQFDIYKGLSYKMTWNYYGYDSKTPVNISVPITSPIIGSYSLEPIAGPNFNGSNLMLALRYAF